MQTQNHLTTPTLRNQVGLLFEQPKPIFGILKIDRACLTYFYLQAWGFTLPPYNWEGKIMVVTRTITETARAFREKCKVAGIKVGHGALLKFILNQMYHRNIDGLPDLWLARELLDLYFDVPIEFHEALTPYVQLKLRRYVWNYQWQLTTKGTGEK